MSLSTLDVDHHPLAVDVADFQMAQFSPPKSRRIQHHQNDAVERSRSGLNELRHLLLAKNLRQAEVPSRIRCFSDAPGFPQDGNEEEPQCAGTLIDCVR